MASIPLRCLPAVMLMLAATSCPAQVIETNTTGSESGLRTVNYDEVGELLKLNMPEFSVAVHEYDWESIGQNIAAALVHHWIMMEWRIEGLMLGNAEQSATDVIRHTLEHGSFAGPFQWDAEDDLYRQGTEQVRVLSSAVDRRVMFEEMILAGIDATIPWLLGEGKLDFVAAHAEETIPALLRHARDVDDSSHHACVLALMERFPETALPDEVRAMEAAAERGDAAGELYLGERQLHAEKFEAAVPLLMKSAEQDNTTAQYLLAKCYLLGNGVGQDERKALEWNLRAAEQGDAAAQHELGEMYLQGQGAAQSTDDGVNWLLRAADQNYAPSQSELAGLYFSGAYGDPDHDKAFHWAVKSAEQDYAEGQLVLGACYVGGIGVEVDFEAALDWSEKAAEQGNLDAQYVTGSMYLQGIGTEQDIPRGMFWINYAAAGGHPQAIEFLDSIR